ncbi:MAG: UDP-N-acetylmuramoyl-L-alanine--D-glutamate ligase [Planctomycetes bacterium]|nr:UDP-N-acetylmuramoyl-L-alanine--D-glutamate ligase [Planctomycetota bacterium]
MSNATRLHRFPTTFRPLDLRGQKVLVVGLGTFGGGLGAVLHLVREGAEVTISDTRGPEALAESLRLLEGLPLKLELGRHATADAVAASDWIVASPAVPWTAPPLAAAAARGVPVESEITLLVRLLPCRWLGITGTNGKSTTTMLAMRTLAAAGRCVWGGGNLGGSLLDRWHLIGSDDAVVLELSSFQLEHLGEIGLGPDIALVTNVTHDHLDRHGTFADYVAAKRRVLVRAEVALLQRADPVCQQFGREFGGRVIWYGEAESFGAGEHGAQLVEQRFAELSFAPRSARDRTGEGRGVDRVDCAPMALRGVHNRVNLLAAATAATCFDVPFQNAIAAGFDAKPLQRRLYEIATVRNVLYVDDSVSTSPPAVAAALRAYSGATHLIAGGYDKGIDPEPLLDAMVLNCRSVVLYGAVGPRLAAQLKQRTEQARPGAGVSLGSVDVTLVPDLRAAFAVAVERAGEGDTVLYSPGYASYDQFRNFTERGDLFAALVAEHARRHP